MTGIRAKVLIPGAKTVYPCSASAASITGKDATRVQIYVGLGNCVDDLLKDGYAPFLSVYYRFTRWLRLSRLKI